MNRKDLKKYRNNQIYINNILEKLRMDKETINNLTATLSDMPKR